MIRLLSLILTLTCSAAFAQAPDLVTRGNGRGALACASCHGIDGAGIAQARYPALAAMPGAYIVKQLEDFKSGTRNNTTMREIAAGMNAQEMLAAANYYAALPRPKGKAVQASASDFERGSRLSVNGAWDRDLPACFKCHGQNGTGIAPYFPPLAGQHAGYIVQQLQDWRAGRRKNDAIGLMKAVADRLNDEDIRALGEYLASLNEVKP